MHYKGINYDTGTKTTTGGLTRDIFDATTAAKEIDIIKQELHCNSIRISGQDLDRVILASETALAQGLTVWFSPSLPYSNQASTLEHIIRAAEAAEKLRLRFPHLIIIFVAGCELSLFTEGFVKGDTGEERMQNMFGPFSMIKNMLGIPRTYNQRLNKFLSDVVAIVRKKFNGQVTYASGTWEKIDWQPFDIVGVDYYRAGYNKTTYRKGLQNYKNQGKPVSIMEFGCCTYKGADDKGGMGWAIVDWKKDPPQLKGDYKRDEQTQAKYLLELLTLLNAEEVYAAFVFTFISGNYPHHDDPKYDLDMAAYGIVKIMANDGQEHYKGLPWLPKLAFFKLAGYYSTGSVF